MAVFSILFGLLVTVHPIPGGSALRRARVDERHQGASLVSLLSIRPSSCRDLRSGDRGATLAAAFDLLTSRGQQHGFGADLRSKAGDVALRSARLPVCVSRGTSRLRVFRLLWGYRGASKAWAPYLDCCPARVRAFRSLFSSSVPSPRGMVVNALACGRRAIATRTILLPSRRFGAHLDVPGPDCIAPIRSSTLPRLPVLLRVLVREPCPPPRRDPPRQPSRILFKRPGHPPLRGASSPSRFGATPYRPDPPHRRHADLPPCIVGSER